MIYRTCRANQSKYCSNRIQTSKYTWFNFIPKNLFEQITKIPNFYFLVINPVSFQVLSIIQTIPVLSNSGGQPTILIQLSIIMFVSMIKDFYEDYKRKISDREENTRRTEIQGQKVLWQDIHVGQIVKIYENEYAPADILILGSSQQKGNCFVETKNLDGESNLKLKLTSTEILNLYKDLDYYSKNISLEYDVPNNQLYNFKGTGYLDGAAYDQLQIKEQLLLKLQKQRLTQSDELLKLQQFLNNFNKFSVDINNIILRGCSLRNTEYVYGMVIYSGHDTKIMLNSIKPKYKKSLLEKGLGYQILFLFLFEIVMCLFCSFYYSTWYRDNKNELFYLEIPHDNTGEDNYGYNFIVKVGTWILIFAKFVPISLFVSLEITKLFQGFMIHYDEKCSKDEIKCGVQSSNLIEELGVINYIFSDKTGTLTKNIMVFKQICINGISYGDNNINEQPIIDFVDFQDKQFTTNMQNKEQHNIHLGLLILSLCHSAIIEFIDGKPSYTFTSPDELALLNFAKSKGYIYKDVDDQNIITLKCGDNDQTYQMLYNLEFDSSRKRNSVIVRNLQNNQIMMLSKGADSFMMNNSCAKLDEDDKYKSCLYEYSIKGLRCLVLGYKIISENEYNDWNQQYRQAQYQLEDRELKLRELQDQIEKGFQIIGITAVQDKLQDNVEITIKAFREAGIKVWVITGDKMETAINIGYSCQLLSSKMNLVQIDQTDTTKILEQIQLTTDALAINGDSFQIVINDAQLTQKFIEASSKCQSVLCCRASPKQKQEIVKLVIKNIPNKSCLAIGDGANDVSMISTAHVGVGIIGVEGSQAARAADFAIGEFQILRNLLFVYGRESYRKNSQLIFYTFYKNILLVFPQFWYGIYSAFSGQSLFDAIIYQLYNVIYTSSPIVIYAVFDFQYSYNKLFQNQRGKLYEIGIKNTEFNKLQYSRWLIQATLESIIITFFFSQILDQTISYYGRNYCFYWTGMAIYCVIVIVANLKIMVISHDINIIGIISYLAMISAYFISLTIFMKIKSYDWLYYIFNKLFVVKEFYLANLLVIGSTSLLDYGLLKLFEKRFEDPPDPNPSQVNQVQQDSEQIPLSK